MSRQDISRLYGVIIGALLIALGLMELIPFGVPSGLWSIGAMGLGIVIICRVIFWTEKKNHEGKDSPCKNDPVYEQLYEEMRRFRNLEYTFLAWYTTMLLAILGAGISLAAKAENGLRSAVANLAPLAVVGLLLISMIVSYLIWYCNRNYKELRDNVKARYKAPALKIDPVPFGGHDAMQALLWAVTFVCLFVLWHVFDC